MRNMLLLVLVIYDIANYWVGQEYVELYMHSTICLHGIDRKNFT